MSQKDVIYTLQSLSHSLVNQGHRALAARACQLILEGYLDEALNILASNPSSVLDIRQIRNELKRAPHLIDSITDDPMIESLSRALMTDRLSRPHVALSSPRLKRVYTLLHEVKIVREQLWEASNTPSTPTVDSSEAAPPHHMPAAPQLTQTESSTTHLLDQQQTLEEIRVFQPSLEASSLREAPALTEEPDTQKGADELNIHDQQHDQYHVPQEVHEVKRPPQSLTSSLWRRQGFTPLPMIPNQRQPLEAREILQSSESLDDPSSFQSQAHHVKTPVQIKTRIHTSQSLSSPIAQQGAQQESPENIDEHVQEAVHILSREEIERFREIDNPTPHHSMRTGQESPKHKRSAESLNERSEYNSSARSSSRQSEDLDQGPQGFGGQPTLQPQPQPEDLTEGWSDFINSASKIEKETSPFLLGVVITTFIGLGIIVAYYILPLLKTGG